jgi:hypothetical chaperone protein
VPSKIYFDLATWHLINTTYTPNRVAELKMMRRMYTDHDAHRRLMQVLNHHRGHDLAACAEAAKIAVSESGMASIDLGFVEPGLQMAVEDRELGIALQFDVERIVSTARETVRMAQLDAGRIGAVYFTGGSTGLGFLAERIGAAFPAAEAVRGDRYSSVVSGLAITAQRRFGPETGRAKVRRHRAS